MSVRFANGEMDDVPALRQFFGEVYGQQYRLAVDDTLFRWQFCAGGDECHVKVAWLDGQIAACLGYLPVNLSVGPRMVRAAWTANWMVHPEHRSLGLGPLLVRSLVDDHDAVLAVGISSDARQILPRMGWTDFGCLERHVVVLDTEGAARLTVDGDLHWPPVAPPPAGGSDARCVVRDVRRFDEDATDLWSRVAARGIMGTSRRTSYLNWRYADHPVFDYRLFEARVGDELVGLGVYRIEEGEHLPARVGRLVELVGTVERSEEDGDDEADGASAILSRIARDASQAGVALLDYFVAGPGQADLLRRHGFFAHPEARLDQLPVLFHPIDRRRADIAFMAHLGKLPRTVGDVGWYVTKGDGDQDRPN